MNNYSTTYQVFAIVKKEFIIEWRNRSAFYSILLYSLLTVFLIFFSFKEIDPVTWVNLYWIITLFAAINAMAKSFLQESQGRWAYYYTMFSAKRLLTAKYIYNFLLLQLISIANLSLFSLFLGFPLKAEWMFFLCSFLGVLSFVLMFTLMSAIANKTSKNASITAILSMPLIIPILSILINFSLKTISASNSSLYTTDILLLLSMNGLMLVLGYLLFQFIWQD